MADFDPLYTAEEMRAAESSYAGYPDSVPELMERAGGATALWAMHLVPNAQSWTVVCGGGSNGGDGRVAARHLEEAGRRVRVDDAKAGDTDLGEPDAIVDALFGTGFSGAPRPEAAALIERINAAGKPVLSVDLPSGVDASTGEVAGAAVRADETVTFHGRKVGLVVAPGRFRVGDLHLADIGLDLGQESAGARGTGIGCFYDDPVHEILGLTGHAFQSLYHFTIGMPVDDPRLTSEAGYDWEQTGR